MFKQKRLCCALRPDAGHPDMQTPHNNNQQLSLTKIPNGITTKKKKKKKNKKTQTVVTCAVVQFRSYPLAVPFYVSMSTCMYVLVKFRYAKTSPQPPQRPIEKQYQNAIFLGCEMLV